MTTKNKPTALIARFLYLLIGHSAILRPNAHSQPTHAFSFSHPLIVWFCVLMETILTLLYVHYIHMPYNYYIYILTMCWLISQVSQFMFYGSTNELAANHDGYVLKSYIWNGREWDLRMCETPLIILYYHWSESEIRESEGANILSAIESVVCICLYDF